LESDGRASLQCLKPVPMNTMYCSGQRGDYRIREDTRRPIINASMII